MAKVAFLGLGVMGFHMAGHLVTRGRHEVTVYNRTRSRAEQWGRQFHGTIAATPREAAAGKDVVISCVSGDDALRQVADGPDGAFAAMTSGSIYIDHSTTSAEVAREMYQHARTKEIGFIDAPVSGGEIGAKNGVLSVMCGGDADSYYNAEAIITAYARAYRLVGRSGSGQLAKMVNQICIAGVLQGLSEGLHFAKTLGLDVEALISVLSKGAAQSWQMDNRWKTMIEGEFGFGFSVDLMRKDLSICLAEANKRGVHLPLTDLVDHFYSEVQKMGGGKWDTSCLIKRLEQ